MAWFRWPRKIFSDTVSRMLYLVDGILYLLCSIYLYLDLHLLQASPACYGTYFYNVAVVTAV
jgi:hypothetical protein